MGARVIRPNLRLRVVLPTDVPTDWPPAGRNRNPPPAHHPDVEREPSRSAWQGLTNVAADDPGFDSPVVRRLQALYWWVMGRPAGDASLGAAQRRSVTATVDRPSAAVPSPLPATEK